jgi:hypothetical protein
MRGFTPAYCKILAPYKIGYRHRTHQESSAMSLNGTLVAYSTSANIKELRDQASLVSMVWKDHEATVASQSLTADDSPDSNKLETLTIEFEQCNIIAKAVQPNLLIVLVGTVDPRQRRKANLKMTPERRIDPRYPSLELHETDEQSSASEDPIIDEEPASNHNIDETDAGKSWQEPRSSISLSRRDKDSSLGLLNIQRKKLDALTKYLRAEFDAAGFVLPEAP